MNICEAQVSPWIQRFAHLLPQGKPVLDLACGSGRHGKWLHAAGFEVLAADRDESALQALAAAGIATQAVDLEAGPARKCWPFEPGRFGAVIVTNYLHRPLFPHILDCLQDRGILLYETFAAGNAAFGKPARLEFLLADGELLQQMHSNPAVHMQVLAYEQGFVEQPRPAMVQRICARKAAGSHPGDILPG
jgi:SAM-dependent methyltransferase